MTIYSTQHYSVVLQDGVYKVVNNKTGVIEASEGVLPKAISTMEVWNSTIERYEQKQKEGLANVVTIGTKG